MTEHSPTRKEASSLQDGLRRTQLAPATFSVSARVAMQLGRESISSSNTAIIELVKNAYDADAESVTIRFADLGSPDAKLLIEDDGHGMTESELREHWLCIGTSNKNSGKSRGKKRIQTGEKGLGRLGLDRLCRRVVLQSMRKRESDQNEGAELFVDIKSSAIELDVRWDRYQESPTNRLESIQHTVSAIEHLNFDALTYQPKEFPHGTRLTLEGLKDDWTRARLNELVDELSLLLSPFAHPEDFSIMVDSGMGWEDVDGPVHSPVGLLNHANWKVVATIDPVAVIDGFWTGNRLRGSGEYSHDFAITRESIYSSALAMERFYAT